MTGMTLAVMVIGLALVVLWLDTTDARDLARIKARRACQELGVQLLDQTVALRHTRIRRLNTGWLTIERCFGFEFSETGNDRNRGELRLRCGQATQIVLTSANLGTVVIDPP